MAERALHKRRKSRGGGFTTNPSKVIATREEVELYVREVMQKRDALLYMDWRLALAMWLFPARFLLMLVSFPFRFAWRRRPEWMRGR